MDVTMETDPFGRVWKLKDELLQDDVAAWNRAYVQMRPVGTSEQRQASLQAAIVAGWIVSPPAAVEQRTDLETGKSKMVYTLDGVDIGRLPARQVMWYGRECDLRYQEETTVPDPKA